MQPVSVCSVQPNTCVACHGGGKLGWGGAWFVPTGVWLWPEVMEHRNAAELFESDGTDWVHALARH